MHSRRRYRVHERRRKSIFLRIFLVLLVVGAVGVYKYFDLIAAVDESDDAQVSFQIKQGQSVKEVAANLKEKDLIKNETAFYLYVRNNDLDQNIIAGRFLLARSMSVSELLQSLTDPVESEAIITIQEGLTIRAIDEKIYNQGLIEQGEFTSAVNNFDDWGEYSFLSQSDQENLPYRLEGFIYPDTYFVDPFEFQPEQLIRLGLNNFEKKLSEVNINNSEHSVFDTITMASIIENEVFGKEDRKIVSGIFWKRLENSWTLGADITLIYLKDDRSITMTDINADDAYNTRKNLGLPPGPVSNPSIESIEAAINPTDSEYWFYLTTLDTGEVIYARSNEEHNANRFKYL